EYKPGAGHTIAYEYVSKLAPADGYTIGAVNVTILATLPVTYKDLRFDPFKDLSPVIEYAEGRYLFGSAASLPWKSLYEMVTYAKANPGKLNYGASSTLGLLQTEGLVRDLGINVEHIPYSEGGEFLKGLVGAEVQMGFVVEGLALGFGDKFRVL